MIGKTNKINSNENLVMEMIDNKINEKLNRELGIPTLVKSFMGKSVVESTLNRVKKHLDSEKGFFIISTHLPKMDEETEVKRAKALVEELKQRGLGYIPLRGKYTREDTCETEYEHSFFIAFKLKNKILQCISVHNLHL